MATPLDSAKLEKQAGQKAARTIRRNLKLELAGLKDSGLQLKTIGTAVAMKFGQLNHITIKASTATFMQHHGFEGKKINGVRMRMKPFNHFNKVLEKGNVLEKLATEIGEIRAEEILSNIRF